MTASLGKTRDDLADEIEDLRDEVKMLEAENSDLRDRIWDLEEEQGADLRALADEAHRILGDLAWRATRGEQIAQAAEGELRGFLTRVRDSVYA